MNPFSSSGLLARILGSVVLPPMLAMFEGHAHVCVRGAVRSELVGLMLGHGNSLQYLSSKF
jgi:hypothetical protein